MGGVWIPKVCEPGIKTDAHAKSCFGRERKKQADPSRFVEGLPMGSELLYTIFLPEKITRKNTKKVIYSSGIFFKAVLLIFGDR